MHRIQPNRRLRGALLAPLAALLLTTLALLAWGARPQAARADDGAVDFTADVLARPAASLLGEWRVRVEATGADFTLLVDAATRFDGTPPAVGDRARVRGVLIGPLHNRQVQAARMERLPSGDDHDGYDGRDGRVRGILRSRPAAPQQVGAWTIECRPRTSCIVQADAATYFDDDPAVGEWVEAETETLANGDTRARSLRSARVQMRELVVRLQPNADGAAFAAAHNLTLANTILQSANIYLYITHRDEEDDIAEVRADPRALWVEFNYVNSIPNDDGYKTWRWGGNEPTGYINQAAFDQVRLTAALGVAQGAGTIVAVLDTGVQLGHPALAGHLLPGRDMVADDLSPQDEGPGFGWGHGTHVAGIVARCAPQAMILPVRVLDADGRGSTFALAYAIEWAVDQGADVINLSLGADAGSNVLREAIAAAEAKGVVVVAAAGNDNSNAQQYPADFPGVLSVAAVDAANHKAAFSNYGDWVDVAAPGVGITSTVPFTTGAGFASWSGTSMSTAFVSGAAALLLSRGTPSAQVDATLTASAHSLAASDPQYGPALGGLLDAASALGVPMVTPSAYLPFAARGAP